MRQPTAPSRGRKPLTTITVALSNAVRRHEREARDIYRVRSREALVGAQLAQWIANALKRGRHVDANRIPLRDARKLVELVSWPSPRVVWPRGCNPPSKAELEAFLARSWDLLRTIAPVYKPPSIALPSGAAAELAPHLSKLLAGVVTHRLAFPDGGNLKSGRGLMELPGGYKVAGDLEAALRFHLSRYEQNDPSHPFRGNDRLERALAEPDERRRNHEKGLHDRLWSRQTSRHAKG